MNIPVKYSLSKLLKEKGFNESTTANYYILAKDHSENYKKDLPIDESKIFLTLDSFDLERKIQIDEEHKHNVYHVMCCPTISKVVMWLYEKHGIWISVQQNTYENKFDYLIIQRKADSWYVTDNDELIFNLPTEAYEAAIDYVLNNLI